MRLIILLCLLVLPLQVLGQRDLTRYVNPFIGTGGHGHTFPGAIVPFGMVQLSPDTRLTGWDGCSGYHYSDSKLYGFSHTHLSGTGISDYGDILLLPTLKLARTAAFQHRNETATPGYYSVKLDDDNIFVELTATARVGLHRYTFPRTEDANVIIDLAHRDKVIDADMRFTSRTTIVGWRRSQAWAKDQIIYFAAEFSQPFTKLSFTDSKFGLSVHFDARSGAPLLVKVGISSVDVDGALRNLRAELNHWDFDKVRSNAAVAWNAELNKIQTNGGTNAQLTNLHRALSRDDRAQPLHGR